MKNTALIAQAQEIINNATAKSLSQDERQQQAVKLASLMLQSAQASQTTEEKRIQEQLARMMNDSNGKVFTTLLTDQCFRSHNPSRIANQMVYILKKFGVPKYLSWDKRAQLSAFKWLGKPLAPVLIPLTKQMIRKETSTVILPGEKDALNKHMQQRRQEGVRINLNHLGEAILGEEEAQRRLQIYLNDLTDPNVEYVSIKISTIFSQINLLAWEDTIQVLSARLKLLYSAAKNNLYRQPDGKMIPKFVNLDMEEFRDLELTVDVFRRTLDDPEFFKYSAGIVLQSYLPDSYHYQKLLTEWAMERVAKGGAPIKIRIVKGANLAMEQVEAALKGWPQAPYDKKSDVDANYKRMVHYGCEPKHAAAVNIGIASHNLFDIAYALLLRAENGIQSYVTFEMLEGMADHMRRAVQELSHDMLLYCPAAKKEDFQNAVAYLIRRLDENTAPENFLRHLFELSPGTSAWEAQLDLFKRACQNASQVRSASRKTQNRLKSPEKPELCSSFKNEPDTDWSIKSNREWAEKIINSWQCKQIGVIPIVIGGETISTEHQVAIGEDPSYPGKELYRYTLANSDDVNKALETAVKTEKTWSATPIEERSALLAKIAQGMRCSLEQLIGSMIADTGKTIFEADVEISEAIDFAEYYRRVILEFSSLEDVKWQSKGTVLVAPPWNFPCSIPAGGILAALAAGNCVIFKPASEAVLVGWELVQIFWNAGISKEVLQFITCEDEPVGSLLIKDPRISCVVLTGATATAKLFLKMRPGIDLLAETGGKNALIITNLSDRDLAIKDLIHSAFGHAGQKCSACSLAICEAEVYDDPEFRAQLRDAAASLRVGSPWNLATRINPLIHAPNPTLLRGLTSLEEGEEWLLEPKQDQKNPNLWSPGIKLGVKPSSFTYQNELFGPVLGVMRADDLAHAIQLANGTPYGLTSGLHSLDEREHRYWIDRIEAGNCYINRGITGAIVLRQPFGGCKESSFGQGSKAGGPNYIIQLMRSNQLSLPTAFSKEAIELDEIQELEERYPTIQDIGQQIEKNGFSPDQVNAWKKSILSYKSFWKHYFSKKQDASRLLGQDNFFYYVPHKQLTYRLQYEDTTLDIYRVIAGALICGTHLEVSGDPAQIKQLFGKDWLTLPSNITLTSETDEHMIERINKGEIKRIRFLHQPSQEIEKALGNAASNVTVAKVMANGRLELLQYLREVSLSIDYHRYGNLGSRESEKRTPLAMPVDEEAAVRHRPCGPCCC